MMLKNVWILLILIPTGVFCQSSEIWLLKIDSKTGNILFSDPKIIAGKPGYENQPIFSKNGKEIYYTADKDSSLQTAIFAYTLSTGNTRPLTFSTTSPYSPKPLPYGNGISVVLVEEDSTQRVWQIPFSRENPKPIFEKRDSVAYYDWVDTNSALVCILPGKFPTMRLSLQNADGSEKMIAENVERGIIAGKKGAFFIQQIDTTNYLAWTDYKSSKTLVKTPGGSRDMVIYKNYVLMASGVTIYGAKILNKNTNDVIMEAFKPIQDLSKYGFQNITRMAVSPDEKTIAIVQNLL